jgi:hypothetical protein
MVEVSHDRRTAGQLGVDALRQINPAGFRAFRVRQALFGLSPAVDRGRGRLSGLLIGCRHFVGWSSSSPLAEPLDEKRFSVLAERLTEAIPYIGQGIRAGCGRDARSPKKNPRLLSRGCLLS